MGGAWGFFTPTPAAQSPLRLTHPGPPAATMLGGGTRRLLLSRPPPPLRRRVPAALAKPTRRGLLWAEQKLLGPHWPQTQTSNRGPTQHNGLLICQKRNAFHEF